MALAQRMVGQSKALINLCRQASPSLSLRGMATGDEFKKRERGEEAAHFKREEAKLLQDLLAKVKKQADAGDSAGAAAARKADLEALKTLVGKYNMSDADLDALVAWKHS